MAVVRCAAVGLFTQLDDAAIAEIARTFDLGAVQAYAGVEAGTVNSNYRVESARGVWFVRVNEGKAEDDVAYEAELVAFLAGRGVPTPPAQRATDGKPYARVSAGLVTVFPWLPAARLLARSLGADECARAGEALARLHQAGKAFPRRRKSRYDFEHIVARWQGLPAAPAGSELAAAIADAGAEIDLLAKASAERARLPRGVIHGDLFVDNVLRAEDGHFVLLDFEQASDGAFAYDLAVMVNAWGYGDAFIPARVAALCAGYERVQPLMPEERFGLYREARAAAMRFTVTRITDVELDERATPLVRATKDYRRYHARLKALRALGERGFARLAGF